jgi:hypothetical protein
MIAKRFRGARLAAICAILLLSGGRTAMAQTPTLAECAAIQSDSERLACYDRISGARPTAAPEEPEAAASPNRMRSRFRDPPRPPQRVRRPP